METSSSQFAVQVFASKLARWITRAAGFVAILATLAGVRVAAQATSGVNGVVTDPSGAVVAGATVTLSNTAIGFTATTKTNDVGEYEFLNVPPSETYKISVTKDGFREYILDKVILNVGTKSTQNVQLIVGGSEINVEVTSHGETTIDTTDASIGTVVEGAQVADLPSLFVNNAANWLSLAPGVGSGGDVTGTRSDQTNITLDGLDVNDQRTGEAFYSVVRTPLDSIQELRATVGGDDVTYGHSAGGQLELVTKSGTDSFHGQAFDFNRVTALAANDFFNNLNDIPKPPLIRNQFGGDIGGPILKQKLFFFFSYNGLRAKASQELDPTVPLADFRNGQLDYINTSNNIVATPVSGPNSLPALDPSGIGADPSILSLISSRPYPQANNFNVGDGINTGGYEFVAPVNDKENVFSSRVDYQLNSAHRLFARGTWDRSVDDDDVNHVIATFPGDPTPEATITDHSRSWVVGDSWIVSPNITDQISFGETTSLLVFPLSYDPTFPNLLTLGGFTAPYNGDRGFNEQFPIVPVYQFHDTFNWSKGKHTIQLGGAVKPVVFKSGNLTDYNSFGVGIGGSLPALTASLRPSDISADSFAINEWDSLFSTSLGRFASVNAGYNYDLAGNPLPQGQVATRDYHSTEYEFFAQDVWNVRSDLTLTYGLRWSFHNPLNEVHGYEAIPSESEYQIFSARTAQAAQGTSGPFAVPLVSYSLGGSVNHAPGYYRPEYSDFAPRLSVAYSPAFTSGVLGHVLGDRKSSIRASFDIGYDNTLIGQGFELDETSFLFSNSTATSYGSEGAVAAFSPGGDPRFAGISSLPPVPSGGVEPRPTYTPNVDANGVPIGFFTNFGFGPNGPLYNFDPNYHTPYEMSFSLDLQRELPGDWLIDVGYLGKQGRRLTALGDPAQTLNFKDAASGQFLYSAFGAVQTQMQAGVQPGPVGGPSLTAQPWFENQMNAALMAATGMNCQNYTQATFGVTFNCTNLAAAFTGAYIPDGDVSSTLVTLSTFLPTGNPEQGLILPNVGLLAQDGAAGFVGNYSAASYNALIVQAKHRLSHDLTMELSYTYSHSIDNDSGIQNNLIGFSAAEVCDLRNLRVCRGNSDFDATHTFKSNFEYGLPFGRGKRWASSSSRMLDEVIGGWTISGIFSANTGFPIKIDSGTFPIDFTQSAPAVFVGTQADIKGGIHEVAPSGSNPSPTIQYFSNETNALGAFQFPFGGGTGNRNVARGPDFWDVDLAVLKDFKMPWSENHKLQFRAEGINAFNHVNFSAPGTGLLSPLTFGNISSDVTGPRNIQLALKYSF